MYDWPDPEAVIAEFRQAMEAEGGELIVRSMDDVLAGMARASLAAEYDETEDIFGLAALLFEALAVRHPLRDGNKRLGFQMALDFLSLNGIDVDLPQAEVVEVCRAVVAKEQPVDALAGLLRESAVPPTAERHS
jgi:death-on-curing protein